MSGPLAKAMRNHAGASSRGEQYLADVKGFSLDVFMCRALHALLSFGLTGILDPFQVS
jgi:hypothetical protein